MFELNHDFFTMDNITDFFNKVGDLPIVKNGKKISYYNVPAAFDIETSSFYKDGIKVAIMYLWQFGINANVIIGRTWDDFITLVDLIRKHLQTSENKRLIVYVHNLSHEFQYIRKKFKWSAVFCNDIRSPLYAVTDTGIEFRCSYMLSGYSLAKLGDELQKYHVKKLVGSLDYKLIRHSGTFLTDNEIKYGVNDVLVVMAYIQEEIERDGNITRIPLTKTGYVRNYCRKACLYNGNSHHGDYNFNYSYKKLMNVLKISPDVYEMAHRAFQGGFTHANYRYINQMLFDVDSFDFTSSYPYVMIAFKFPMSQGKKINYVGSKFRTYLNKYCCLFNVEFKNLRPRIWYDYIISASKCKIIGNREINNGRVVSADLLYTTVTDVDYKMIEKFYEWDSQRISNFYIFYKTYLPTEFVDSIITLYESKTKLKGVEGKEVEYMISKNMLNSCYGMTVTNIVRDELTYDNNVGWLDPIPGDAGQQLTDYNNSSKRFLYYLWGVWVTAYARANLYRGLIEFGDDYIYSDTDSIKCLNADKHMQFICEYNADVEQKLRAAAEYHHIDFERMRPTNIKGVEKMLGVWEWETEKHKYKIFKTLGAKRYMIAGDKVLYDADENIYYNLSITVSGVNKFHAVPYLLKKYGVIGSFEAFDEGFIIPAEHTGKLTHTYIDDLQEGVVTDYRGVQGSFSEESSVHLEPCEYSLSLADEFIKFLKYFRGYLK